MNKLQMSGRDTSQGITRGREKGGGDGDQGGDCLPPFLPGKRALIGWDEGPRDEGWAKVGGDKTS